MPYKIAVASSDEIQVDETFGSAERWIIYQVVDGVWEKLEERTIQSDEISHGRILQPQDNCGGGTTGGCGQGHGGGCGGSAQASAKVDLVSDCRCVVCKKIGFHFQKQLERKAISAFDVSCSVEEALRKISQYFSRIDRHESLRVSK